ILRQWPHMLAGEGLSDPILRRNALLSALALRWQENPPPYPVIAAGSTGSTPATARLLRIIARLPQGLVVLPGLDLALAEAAWKQLGPHHPQAGMKELLARAGVARAEVQLLAPSIPPSCGPARVEMVRAALL